MKLKQKNRSLYWTFKRRLDHFLFPLRGRLKNSSKAKPKVRSWNILYASPVGVGNRIYLLDREGTTQVIRHGSEFGVLATNTLEDQFDASPVIVGDELYLRGHQYLYCIAEE